MADKGIPYKLEMETGSGFCPAQSFSVKRTSYGKIKASFGPISFRVLRVFGKSRIPGHADSGSSFGPFSFDGAFISP